MTQSLSAEEIAELVAEVTLTRELHVTREQGQALLAMASRLVERDEAETYLIDSGLLGRGIVQWAKEAGWPGPTSQTKGG